jgi:F0F1-type ATP synthase epsilon subunit
LRIAAPAGGPDRVFAAGEGFARIDQKSVTVFTDMAEDAARIDLNDAEDAKRRAEAALAEAARLSEDERRAADLVVRECLVKIQLTRRRKL